MCGSDARHESCYFLTKVPRGLANCTCSRLQVELRKKRQDTNSEQPAATHQDFNLRPSCDCSSTRARSSFGAFVHLLT